MAARRDVLVIIHAPLTENLSGPEIRGWELARSLAHHGLKVTVAAPGASGVRDGVLTVPGSRLRLLREVARHDAVLAPAVPAYVYVWQALVGGRAVADLYDPVDLEHAELDDETVRAEMALFSARVRLQLRFADFVLCASEPQKARLAELGAGQRSAEVVVVPFGLGPPPEATGATPIRDRFPEIAASDRIVLWWGSVWRWFDAPSAIRAFVGLAERRPDVKLVLAAGKSPRAETAGLSALDEARELAESLGLAGRSVFFLDEWIPYDDRHLLLQEADLGITMHRAAAESPFAARARYLDYLWCRLPSVLNGGDPVAEELGGAGFAELVPPGDADAAAAAIERVLADPGRLAEMRRQGDRLAGDYRWDAVVAPAAERLKGLDGRRRRTEVGALARAMAGYYRLRAVAAGRHALDRGAG